MRKYVFIENPSHGWLRVPVGDARGIQFSSFSWKEKDWYYLEEDCDAPKFLQVLKERGEPFEIVHQYSENFRH